MQAVTSSSFLTYRTLKFTYFFQFRIRFGSWPEVAWRSVWESPNEPCHSSPSRFDSHHLQATLSSGDKSVFSLACRCKPTKEEYIPYDIYSTGEGQTRTVHSSIINPYYHSPNLVYRLY